MGFSRDGELMRRGFMFSKERSSGVILP